MRLHLNFLGLRHLPGSLVSFLSLILNVQFLVLNVNQIFSAACAVAFENLEILSGQSCIEACSLPHIADTCVFTLGHLRLDLGLTFIS